MRKRLSNAAITKLKRRFYNLPPLRISRFEFEALLEYSCSKPTGIIHGKRWRRHDGAHDPRCPKTCRLWVVCEYEIVERHEDGTITYRTHWFRPVFPGKSLVALIGHVERMPAHA